MQLKDLNTQEARCLVNSLLPGRVTVDIQGEI